MKLREYQIRLAKDAADLLRLYKIACLFMEVRTGKTLTALEACKLFGASRVLFITKIKAIPTIRWDYDNFGYTYHLTIINRESLHKISENNYDVVVIDEVHGYASFPKPSIYQREVKKRFGNIPMIFLSGTPTPESYSQFFHIFNLSNHSPFEEPNFYKWANKYVNVKLKYLGYAQVKDYSEGIREKIIGKIRHYIIKFTQAEAGFTTSVKEMVLFVDMKPITYDIVNRLISDFVVTNKSGQVIMADTGAKMSQKVHQLFSGTCKFEDGTYKVIDDSKATFIYEHFKGQKIAIFYKFVAELEAIKSVMGDQITTDLEEFNNSEKWIALQIVSGREGISLKAAKYLVYYNIDFSAVSYWQSRDRLTTMNRSENEIFWVFSKKGVEEKIYKRVLEKRDYTSSHFKSDYNVKQFPGATTRSLSKARL